MTILTIHTNPRRSLSGEELRQFISHRADLSKTAHKDGCRRFVAENPDYFVDYQIERHAEGYSYRIFVRCGNHIWTPDSDDNYETREACVNALWVHSISELSLQLAGVRTRYLDDEKKTAIQSLIDFITERRSALGIEEPEMYGENFALFEE